MTTQPTPTPEITLPPMPHDVPYQESVLVAYARAAVQLDRQQRGEPTQALGFIAAFAGTRTLKTIRQIREYAKHNADSSRARLAHEPLSSNPVQLSSDPVAQEPAACMVKGKLLSWKHKPIPDDCLFYAAPVAAQPAQPAASAEPFMYGIMGPDGKPYWGELCVSGDKGDLAETIFYLNGEKDTGPYAEVALHLTAPVAAQPSVPADDGELCTLAEHYGASVAWANEPHEFHHLIEFTPPQLRAMLAATPTPSADEQNELKAIYAAARHAGWMFTKHADGIVRMEPLISGTAQTADGQAQQVDRSANLQGNPVDESANLQDRAQQDANTVDAERYREVRRMSLREFSEIYHANLSGKPFDALIDAARAQQGGQ